MKRIQQEDEQENRGEGEQLIPEKYLLPARRAIDAFHQAEPAPPDYEGLFDFGFHPAAAALHGAIPAEGPDRSGLRPEDLRNAAYAAAAPSRIRNSPAAAAPAQKAKGA
jgi:hypothetical protein